MSLSENKPYYILPILRHALWNKTSEEVKYVPWKEVMYTAEEQTVFGLAFSALESLRPKEVGGSLLFEYIGRVNHIEQRNYVIDATLRVFTDLLKSYNLQSVIVKGQVVGSCYPNPFIRQSGDIDFWVSTEELKKCEELVEQNLRCTIKRAESEKHVEFQWKGIQFELHSCLASFSASKHQNYFDRLVEQDKYCTIVIKGTEVASLSPTLNALYIFIHLFHHLIDTGVGLRQFCDWMMWLHRYKEDINREELVVHLKALDLEKPYRVLGVLLVHDLGLLEEEFPLTISDKDIKRSRRVLKDVMKMGNFGHNKEQVYRLGVLHSIQTGLHMLIQGIKYFDLAPKEIAGRLPKRVWWYLRK